YGDLYERRSIPVSTYGFDDEVQTLGVRNLLVARTDMPEPVAHWITELLFNARSHLATAHREARRLDPRSAVATFPLPLPPGAARYYLDSKPLARRHLHPFVSSIDSHGTDKGALGA